MPNRRRFEHYSLLSSHASAVPPLGEIELAIVQREMADIAPDWAVALESTGTDNPSLVVVPDDGDDRSGPSFVISRESNGLRVDQVHWDEVTEGGLFAKLSDVVEFLGHRLA